MTSWQTSHGVTLHVADQHQFVSDQSYSDVLAVKEHAGREKRGALIGPNYNAQVVTGLVRAWGIPLGMSGCGVVQERDALMVSSCFSANVDRSKNIAGHRQVELQMREAVHDCP